MAVTAPPPAADKNNLRHRLAHLRRRLRLVALVRGVGLVVALLLTAGLLAGVLDWAIHLPALVRAVILVGTLTGAGYLGFRFLLLPLAQRVDDLTLALRIEESYPALNDSLASTVQFLEQAEQEPDGESAALRREAMRRALGNAAGCDFNRVIDARGLRTALAGTAVAAALVLPLVIFLPALALTGLERLANPFGAAEWPKKTQLELDLKEPLQIGHNRVFRLTGKVAGVIPEKAKVTFRFDGFPPVEQRCDLRQNKDEKFAGFVAELEPSRVQHNFRFQVEANDAVSKEYQVKVLPPPVLVALNGEMSPQVQLFFPEYTELPSPINLTPGVGNIDVVLGTRVRFQAAADRPLSRAWIEFQPEQVLLPPPALAGALGILAATLSQGPGMTIPATLSEDRRVLTVEFQPRSTGVYGLYFEDDNNLASNRPFELRLRFDPAPAVTLDRPAQSRDTLSMLPSAVMNLQASAEDPQYAVRSLSLRYRTNQPDPAGAAPRTLALYDHSAAPRQALAAAVGPAMLAWPGLKLRPMRVDVVQHLPLRRFTHPDGAPLKEGDTLTIQAWADDFDNVTPDKQPGVSHEVDIKIVGPNAIDLELNKAQAQVQQELLKLREKEREAIQKVLNAEKKLKRGEQLTPEEQEQLLQAEQMQQQIQERVGTQDKGLRGEVARIQETLKQNNMQNSAVRDRMADVGRELDRLAEKELEQAMARLTAARKQAERQAQLEEKVKEAEKLAQAEEQSAQRKKEQAAEAKQQAQKAAGQERLQLERDAQRLEQQADNARKQAEELRQQAEKDRQEAKRSSPQQPLTDARKQQEEVEKTINDLLQRLEPWSSAREIKAEAKHLLEEQRQLQNETEKLNNPQTQGKPRNELAEKEVAELKALQEQQQRIEERTNQLLEKMDRLAEQRQTKDPQTAQELKDARQQAMDSKIGDQMKAAQEQIGRNELNKARENQKQSIAELEKLVKNLEDRREAELDRLAKKLREAEKELDKLREEQERLAKKIKEAGQIKDEAKREEELKRLAREQKQLQEKTEQMAKQLTRLRADRAGQTLGKAGEQMGQAGQQMQEGKKPEDPQEALDRLNEAKQDLERERKRAEEELQREQLARVADTLARVKERQDGHNAEAARIQTEVQQAGAWTRGLRSSLSQLADAEDGLGTETEELAKKELANTPVFARLVRRAAESMKDARDRARAMINQQPAAKQLPDAELKRMQQQATKRLQQVLEAIKEQVAGGQGGQAGGGDGGGDGGGGGGAGDSGLPPPAQLKLLKALQVEVNEKTEEFKKKNPNLDKLAPAEKAELDAIRKMQQDVLELLEELRKPADEPGDDGDKK